MTDNIMESICPLCGWEKGAGPLSHMHLKPGTILQEKYLIGRALGQGGFGVTYLAKDMNLDVKLAIKEYLPQDLASRSQGNTEISVYSGTLNAHYHDGLEKFLQEAKTLARFEGHPNIVSVRDFFKANGTAYLVMSYIEGVTLKEFIQDKGGKISVEQAINIMVPVLEALKEVHRFNTLHRDISPDNIFITAKGKVVLIDFGAARQSVKEQGRSMSIIMKPGFTPEEQYRSKGQQGPWTDIYATGATMYRAITGNMPPESLDRMVEDDLVPPSMYGIEIEATVENALLKAMAVMAKNRFQTAESFQHALVEGITEEESNPPTPTPLPTPLPIPTPSYQPSNLSEEKSSEKNNKLFLGIGAVISGIALVLFLVFSLNNTEDLNEKKAKAIEDQATTDASIITQNEESDQVANIDSTEEEPHEEPISYDLHQALRSSGYTELLGVTEQELFGMYGDPFDSFYWEGGLFYEYQNFYAMVNEYSRDRKVMIIGLRELPGISVNASFDEVKRVYGEPEWDEIGTSNNSHLLHYDVSQQYAVVFEGFSGRNVDFITIHPLYLEWEYDTWDEIEHNENVDNVQELGHQLWQTWIYVGLGTSVWSEPNINSWVMGETIREGDFFVTDYHIDVNNNLWLELELINDEDETVYGWIAY